MRCITRASAPPDTAAPDFGIHKSDTNHEQSSRRRRSVWSAQRFRHGANEVATATDRLRRVTNVTGEFQPPGFPVIHFVLRL